MPGVSYSFTFIVLYGFAFIVLRKYKRPRKGALVGVEGFEPVSVTKQNF